MTTDGDTLNRFDRIVAILIQLQSKRVVRAQDLAERFQVSLRTIYRDVRSLESSGVPVISEAGVGYSLMEGYRLPPVMFTKEEAGSFVAAEKLMEKFTDKSLGSYHESAMNKVKSVLRGKEKAWIHALESQVLISPAQELFNKDIPNALEIIFESIAEKRQVFIHYRSFESAETSERTIEPVGLFHENNYWYIIGFCYLRESYRQFRTDRIRLIQGTSISFQRNHPSLEDMRSREDQSKKTKIRILVDKEMVKYIQGGRKYYGFHSEKTIGNRVEMTFMTSDIEHGFPRWYLMFGDYANILEPDTLKIRVKELLTDMQKRLL